MNSLSEQTKTESLKSLESTIHKLEKTAVTMKQKAANTAVTERRLLAHRIALVVLEEAWEQKPQAYNRSELTDAREILLSVMPSLLAMIPKFPEGTFQRTLLDRRIKAAECALAALDDVLKA